MFLILICEIPCEIASGKWHRMSLMKSQDCFNGQVPSLNWNQHLLNFMIPYGISRINSLWSGDAKSTPFRLQCCVPFYGDTNVGHHCVKQCHLFDAKPWFYSNADLLSINSLAPGCHFKTAIFNLVLLVGIFILSNDNALKSMPWDLTDDKSTLVQVMAWCRQATSHYLSQCRPSSMSPNGVTRPQWVKCLGANSSNI